MGDIKQIQSYEGILICFKTINIAAENGRILMLAILTTFTHIAMFMIKSSIPFLLMTKMIGINSHINKL